MEIATSDSVGHSLIWLRVYPIHEVLASHFGVNATTVARDSTQCIWSMNTVRAAQVSRLHENPPRARWIVA